MTRLIAHACRAALAAAFSLASAAGAFADPTALRAAIETIDLPALQRDAGSEAERKLAAAVELSWTHKDVAAVTALNAALPLQTDAKLKAAGLWELSALQGRLGDFAGAAAAGEAAKALAEPTADLQQGLTFMKGLVGIAPTKAVGAVAGRVEVKRDLAGLMRSDITIGGVTAGAVLDTGANFSTITESLAKKMGLRMLDAAGVSVGSSSKDAVASKLGVAERLSIGGAEFTSVVFIVLPDKDLSFAGGAYTIDAILGMPVFFEMGRIALVKDDGKEWFDFGRTRVDAPAGQANILLGGMSPLVNAGVTVDGAKQPVAMLLDSGAQKTDFSGRFLKEFGALMVGAKTAKSQRGGAGGTVESTTTRLLDKLDLELAGRVVTLSAVTVEEEVQVDRHGTLGQDALGGGFVIDFDVGRLELR